MASEEGILESGRSRAGAGAEPRVEDVRPVSGRAGAHPQPGRRVQGLQLPRVQAVPAVQHLRHRVGLHRLSQANVSVEYCIQRDSNTRYRVGLVQ
jgi:hypothetical protein